MMIMFEMLDTVVLTRDIPTQGLRRGDLGAVVEVLGSDAYEVEFVLGSGRTQALVTLRGADLRAVGGSELLAVRELSHSA